MELIEPLPRQAVRIRQGGLNVNLEDQTLYNQELRFGEIMFKRASRELERLREQLEESASEEDCEGLQRQYQTLSQEVMSFAEQLRTYQTMVSTGSWSAS